MKTIERHAGLWRLEANGTLYEAVDWDLVPGPQRWRLFVVTDPNSYGGHGRSLTFPLLRDCKAYLSQLEQKCQTSFLRKVVELLLSLTTSRPPVDRQSVID